MISNVTDTVKKVNTVLDGGTAVASSAMAKVDEVGTAARNSAVKVSETAGMGAQAAQNLIEKVTK